MTHSTQTRPYTIETVTPADQPNLPALDSGEIDLLTSIGELGVDVRVWR